LVPCRNKCRFCSIPKEPHSCLGSRFIRVIKEPDSWYCATTWETGRSHSQASAIASAYSLRIQELAKPETQGETRKGSGGRVLELTSKYASKEQLSHFAVSSLARVKQKRETPRPTLRSVAQSPCQSRFSPSEVVSRGTGGEDSAADDAAEFARAQDAYTRERQDRLHPKIHLTARTFVSVGG
jgi:hypothetical protein